MTESDPSDDERHRLGTFGRRELLKAAGITTLGLGTLGAGTAAGKDHGPYNGPFYREYDGLPVSPDTVERVTTEVGDDEPEGEGEEGLREVPKKAPQGDSTVAGGGGGLQTAIPDESFVTESFDGLGAADARGVVPSDNQVASNGDYVVQAINSRWAIFTSDGATEFEVTLDDWWQNVSPFIYEQEAEDDGTPADFFDDYIIFDPRARYDAENGHFILLCVEYSLNSGLGAMLLSVSATDDPMGTWYNYRIPAIVGDGVEYTPGLVDFPQLGYDGDSIHLTQNFFTNVFEEATLVTLDKEAAYDGDTVAANHFTDLRNPDGSLAFTVQPASVEDSTPGYFLNSRFFQGQSLTLWTIENGYSETDYSLTHDAIRTRPYHNAPAANQPDTEEKIDPIDTRVQRVAFDGDTLWATHTVNDGRIRWYEIDPEAAALVQSANFKRHGLSTYMPAVEARDGDVVVVYNTSSAKKDEGYVNAEAAVRTGDTPDGKLGSFEVLAEGVDDYDYQDGEAGEPDNGPQVMRWGDYNGTEIDPNGAFWVTAQYTPTPADESNPDEHLIDNDYATRIARIEFDD